MCAYIKKIDQIKFGLMSPEDIREMSVVTVETPDTYEDDGFPIERGLMDPRLGVIDPSLVCRTCGFRGGDCQGHFGSIELARPVIHVGFGDVIHKILRATCNNCGRVLLPEDVIEDFREKISESMENRESIADILKKLQNETLRLEMSEFRQNEIVEKIMNEVYPDDCQYDDVDREDILLNIFNQLYTEAYLERDENELNKYNLYDFENVEEYRRKLGFKYIDPKQLCPHCKKNQSIANIEASYEVLEAKNADELEKLRQKAKADLEDEHEKKINKINNKIEKLHDIYGGTGEEVYAEIIEKLMEDKAQAIAEFEEKFDDKFENEIKKRTKYYIKQYLQELIQEPILLDKPVTIRQGDYKLTPSEVRERLENISDDDSYVLGVNPEVARPEWMVLTVLPVPPVTVRPSITLDTGERSEDDLTHKLVDILRINQRLLENMEAGAPQLIVEDLWELLQYHVTTYFDNEASGVPPARHRSGRPLKTLTQRLKGKEGRFRSNLSGKRVNFSARTVISPDPNISINEVGVPEMIAKEVTVPVYVTDFNIDKMKKYIQNGPDVHPGANYVIRTDGRKMRIHSDKSTNELILELLEPGFIIERHLKDGDMVLFNRQPSLHRMSMMAHEVKVMPYKTFRLNLCVCPPYNADFDGDEMNMHVFQTVESRAEAKSLLRVQEHILSPRFGGPIIGAIHDHISGAFLLTRTGSEFSEEEALQIIRKSQLEIPKFHNNQWILKYDPRYDEKSFIYKDKGEKWTGKELFSLLLPNDLNLAYSSEISKGKEKTTVVEINEKTSESLTKTAFKGLQYPTDGYVVIKNGILTQGVIDESAFGSFSGKILDKIVKEYGPSRARKFLDESTKMAIYAVTNIGITTSLNDVGIPYEAQDRINTYIDYKISEVDKLVESYNEGYLQPLPGRSLEETLEMRIMMVLGEARDDAGKIAESYILGNDNDQLFSFLGNNAAVMAKTGARASMLNLTQITACVGQQAVRGGRIERGYLNRTLPHFKKGELGAKARGFIHSSYKSGLDPIEFFFHAMGGREGLVDTAIRTAQSGYMQRRLVNALQDLKVNSSGVVSDNEGNVIQTLFGDDGVDPVKSDFGKVADLNRLIDEIRLDNDVVIQSNNRNQDIILEIKKREELSTLKNKSKLILNDFKGLDRIIKSEIRELDEYNIDYDFKKIQDEIKINIKILGDCSDLNELDEIKGIVENSIGAYDDIKSEFKKKIDILKLEVYKITTINELRELITENKDIVSSQLNDLISIEKNIIKLSEDINSSDIDSKEVLLGNLESLENKYYTSKKIHNDFNQSLNEQQDKISLELDLNDIDNLKIECNNFTSKIKSNENIIEINNEFNKIKDNFEKLVEESKNTTLDDEKEMDKFDEIMKYHKLLEMGIISKEEFTELKRQIIFK